MVSGHLIPFFGAGVNLSNRPPGASFLPNYYLPNGVELSESIVKAFPTYPWSDKKDLLRVSWYASEAFGYGALYRHLREIFSGDYPLTDVHEFFAQLPSRLAAKGYPNRHQLIVTTNYDDVLERAFDKAREPYDVLTYVAHNEMDKREEGKFRYTPHDGVSHIIFEPNRFTLPVERTVILKIHGTVDRTDSERDSFVITEDDYIDYLARMNTDSYEIPAVLMAKMVKRHFLFLGYSLGDWNMRVLFKSIRASRPLKDNSWAVMHDTKEWDKAYWRKHNVQLLKLSLKHYVEILNEQLDALPAAGGGTTP
ncbi:MAG TPA: SIR2 family protein [Pyrinomonadaceae bacterium]